ncbi:MAG: 50S ribosomal protein L6 [Methanospirillum sp.]|uniref:50S ribosomal protein L6 n=1 Tax=Methanospirillum sp. TaxID=45200 RepID=UPI00236B1BE3|nr:50S ribosomal protein L6 [Methanospirillum sp.]MDD1727722.1 50S ribosomal protein L6 [Methanospirillum sp.]
MTAQRTVTIPEGVTVSIADFVLKVKGPKGELQRDMWHPAIKIVVENGNVVFTTESQKKQVVAMVGTLASHCKNMCTGVTSGYQYNLKVVYSHFPIQLKIQGEKLEILNFLGEKFPRSARVLPGTSVKLGTDEVSVTGIDKELVGSTASNIEKATRIRDRDPRVFQDGIYIVARGEQ